MLLPDQEYTMASNHVTDTTPLECCLCSRIMIEPQLLKCTHIFCKDCLLKDSDSTGEGNRIPCPLCRDVTSLKKGGVSDLQTNIPLKSIIENVASGVTVCTMCDEKSQSPAVRFCEECGDFMCEGCVYGHGVFTKTARHVTITVEDALSGKIKVKQKCTKHPHEDKEWVCTTCRQSVCLKCRMIDHGGENHNIEHVTKYIKALTDNTRSLQIEVNAVVDSFRGETQEIVDVELTQVDRCIDEIIMQINKAYDEKTQQNNEKRGEIIKECKTIRGQIKGDLRDIRNERELQLGCISSANDLVENGLDTLIEGHARSVHDNICSRLRDDLARVKDHDGEDLKKANGAVRRAECLTFTPNRLDAEPILGALSLNQWRLEKRIAVSLPGGSADCLAATRDGKMVVGYWDKRGVAVVNVHGSQGGMLQGVSVWRVSVLRDGRSVVRDRDGHISVYTQTWERIKEAVFERVDLRGGMDVDGCDRIYVGCEDAGAVRVFTPEGGAPVREIPCHGYRPWLICAMNHSEMLVLSDGSSVIVVDGEGNVMYDVKNEVFGARVAVLQDDNILIGWSKADRLSVDLYTNQLRLVRRVLADYPVKGYMRGIREFSTGEIAVCDDYKLRIFRKTPILPTRETGHYSHDSTELIVDISSSGSFYLV